MFSRACPSCKSFNARRSTVRTSEITLRHLFLSPYRCRDCRTRFWVLSRSSRYAAATFGFLVLVGALAWTTRSFLEMPGIEHATSVQGSTRIPELLKLAENDDPVAEYELSRRYAQGYDVPQSAQEEQKWLERAARHGNVQAQYEYGIALRDGHGTVQDYEAAWKWMQH